MSLRERLQQRREMAAKAGDALEAPDWLPFSTGEAEGVGTVDSRSFWLTLDGMSELNEEQIADRSFHLAEFIAANDPTYVTALLDVALAVVDRIDTEAWCIVCGGTLDHTISDDDNPEGLVFRHRNGCRLAALEVTNERD